MKTRYDTKATGHQFKEGDKVWFYNPTRRKGLSPKLQSHWDGPYTILKIINDVVIRILFTIAFVSVLHLCYQYFHRLYVTFSNCSTICGGLFWPKNKIVLDPALRLQSFRTPKTQQLVSEVGMPTTRAMEAQFQTLLEKLSECQYEMKSELTASMNANMGEMKSELTASMNANMGEMKSELTVNSMNANMGEMNS
ncbi:retrovirus-related Pol polyprotein from transposon 412 [Trichonephila clavipes]|nr:retrovirus-related Pol polyprotein from transposon 412 [Trichonephila clavipes]